MCRNCSERRVTVFDFDGTLTVDDTFLSFTRRCLGAGALLRGLLAAIPWIAGWKLGFVSNSKAKERLYSALYKGKRRADILAVAEAWRPTWRPEVKERLDEAIRRGDTVYIISASLDLWLAPVASRLGVNLCCTETATDADGRLTGRFASPNCHGEEKARRLLAAEPDRAGYRLTVYGDSNGDRALFALADEAWLVKPGAITRVCK